MALKSAIKAAVISITIAAAISFILGSVVNQRFAKIEFNDEELAIDPKPTNIYDADGNIIGSFEADGKEMVVYEDLPITVVEGIVATEDRAFFEHAGYNVRAIFRAVLVDIKAGSFVQGGSTVTQQLSKQVFLNSGKTMNRKLQEVVYATAIEEKYSKQEIMAYYLNHIFYGNRAHGVKSAVEIYFGQTLEEFNNQDRVDLIAKSALLAALPNAPTTLDPYSNPEGAISRRNAVILNMYNQGYITKEEYEGAIAKGLLVLESPNYPDNIIVKYPEFVTYVLSEASEKLGMSVQEVMYSGAQIYTSFKPEIYTAMREEMSKSSMYPSKTAKDDQKVQGAAVLVNPQNGEIYALTGARDETKEFLTFNRAFQAKRQPGSAFKPLISYGPALETGDYTPYSSIGCSGSFGWSIKEHTCSGSTTMTEALRVSSNIPAVWMLNKVGIDYAREYVSRLGIELSDTDRSLPMALGGIEFGVTPLELADAFQVYANGGKRAEAHTIRRIVSSGGQIVYEPDEPRQVIKQTGANQMKNMLRSVVTNGTGTSANISGYNISGKTGTNENPNGVGNKDIWFVGFNESLVGVVWMGYDNTDARHYIPSGQTSYVTAKMFNAIASKVLPMLPNIETVKEVDTIDLEAFRNTEATQITLKWEDRAGLKYEIYRNGTLIGESYDGAHTDVDVEQGKAYTYKVIGYESKTGEKVLVTKEVAIQLPKIEVEEVEEPTIEPSEENTDSSKAFEKSKGTEEEQQTPTGDDSSTSEGGSTQTNEAQTGSTQTTDTQSTDTQSTDQSSGN